MRAVNRHHPPQAVDFPRVEPQPVSKRKRQKPQRHRETRQRSQRPRAPQRQQQARQRDPNRNPRLPQKPAVKLQRRHASPLSRIERPSRSSAAFRCFSQRNSCPWSFVKPKHGNAAIRRQTSSNTAGSIPAV